ncbi:ATP-binding protein [Mycolicibacterium neoaurum]|uniref:HD domain-containing protein n=1 Tax=Mycolicibacterium neoaurum TaxID=1795 RepID=UPI00248BFD01|nr:ATP-binding protein [Mycolicibacterium neoaurum]WBP94792.1 ATP-binding protein [Mycolicibacterium neoaurum]WBS08906.1 ATP-binding protein [Mycolicibacterium neoaurum]
MASLWGILEAKGTPDTVAKAKNLVKYAAGMLELTRDTFPTYTLHNHTHSENIIRIMEDLLGERASNLTAAEAAFLILSAYFHDIGMVFTEEEKVRIVREGSFDTYLREHPEHYLTFRESDELSDTIAEGYCRWRHADRVHDFLGNAIVDQEWFKWGNISIRNYLGKVCQSHGYSAEELKSEDLSSNFLLGECDLRFCAVILRLADILDFDNSRSPDGIYRMLRIGIRADSRTQESDIEWRKHLSSDGFKFATSRDGARSLQLQCGPDHPAVENDLRSFVDVIDKELVVCQRILRYCSDRWSDFILPAKIDRQGIISQGYKYGDFKFTFDRESILEMFMGERLYSNPLVFIRELLQNAIDATRARSLVSGANAVDAGWEINFSNWFDEDGRQWIRVDDNGIGMNQDIVENYLLKIGKSYYSSKEFQADIVRTGKFDRPTVVSIGRFGVGLLSVFMVGDLVELSTRRQLVDSRVDSPLRMSFNEVSGFAVVQELPDTPHPFPSQVGPEFGYRSQPGTSVAVRVDPRKYGDPINLEDLIRSHLLYPPVSVRVNGKVVDSNSILTDDSTAESLDVPINWDMKDSLESLSAQFSAELPQSIIEAIFRVKVQVTPFVLRSPTFGCGLGGRGFIVAVDTTKLIEVQKNLLICELPGFEGLNFGDTKTTDISGLDRMFRVDIDKSLRFSPSGRPDSPLRELRLSFFDNSFSADSTLDRILEFARSRQDISHAEGLQIRDKISRIYGLGNRDSVFKSLSGSIDWESVFKQINFDPSRLCAWSHNGVRLPRPSSSGSWMNYNQWGNLQTDFVQPSLVGTPGYSASVYAEICLEDDLRPELNVARDQVKGTPFSVYSSIVLSLLRATQPDRRWLKPGRMDIDGTTGYLSGSGSSNFRKWTIADMACDPLMSVSDGWIQEPVIQTVDRRLLSIMDVRKICDQNNPIPIRFANDLFEPKGYAPESGGAFDRLVQGLIQLHLNISVTVDGDICVANGGKSTAEVYDLRLFPSAFFVPYDAKTVLLYVKRFSGMFRNDSGYPFNCRHPMIEWYLRVRSVLLDSMPTLDIRMVAALRNLQMLNFGNSDGSTRMIMQMYNIDPETDPFDDLRILTSEMNSHLARRGISTYDDPIGGDLVQLLDR